jgi:hypothetical protein
VDFHIRLAVTYILRWSLKRSVKLELGPAPPFPPRRVLEVYWSRTLRAALHLEVGPIRRVRGLKPSLEIGQKAEINPNPFTPRGRADLVV